MKRFDWDIEKNKKLIAYRGISFEEIVFYIEQGHLVDIVDNPNYKNQKMLVLDINNYIYLVPYVEETNKIFLKTIFPSRKATQEYKKERPYEA